MVMCIGETPSRCCDGRTSYTTAGRQQDTLQAVCRGSPTAGGPTQRTTAHLSNAIDDRYTEVERAHGEEGARLAAASHTAAIDRIETNVRAENIDCDFLRVDGYLFVPPDGSFDVLDKELDA